MRKGIEFSISLEHIVIPQFCPILGIPIVVGDGKPVAGSASLDRIHNNKGYTAENTQVISYRANCIKSDATVEELERIVQFLKK